MEIKENQRYILFKIIAEEEIDQNQLIKVLWRQLFQLYGEFGTSQTGLWMIEYDKNRGYGIIRTNTDALPMVRTTLAIIRQVNGKRCILVTLGTSGTIKALKKKHFQKINKDAQ
ncbi:MAG: Rpp14/Pop5 family protein [Candidatus Helarchaeota archaeon]